MIGVPPLNSNLPVTDGQGQKVGDAVWPQPWGNWLTAVFSQLGSNLIAPVKTVTAAYQATMSDGVILINGNITVTLPLAAKAKDKRITCKAINAGGGTRTVSGNGANIDASATWTTTTQYDKADFVSNGTQWWKV